MAYRADPSSILTIPNAVGSYAVTWDAPREIQEPTPGDVEKKLPVWLLFKMAKERGGVL